MGEIPGLDNGNEVVGLEKWRDLFLDELKQRFAGSISEEREALARAFQSLDRGKMCVIKGRDWLAQQIGLEGN